MTRHAHAKVAREKAPNRTARRKTGSFETRRDGAFKMTYQHSQIMDRAASFTGAFALLSGLFIGAVMFVLQSI